jgi:diacylglycerol O-acyltransferase / wax synthase
VPRGDRLTALDSSFLHLERGAAHMHVASCMTFLGDAPTHDELVAGVEARLHLVPRYRQRLATVPLDQGRPVWVDDPHFNARYHVRHTALPSPGGEPELKRLAGRVFSQRLDRSKPLWEIWLVEGLRGGRFALLSKTHHALVDGVSGVDISTVLFDAKPDPAPVAPPDQPWIPRPVPSSAELLADAVLERATVPGEMLRGVRATLRAPRRVAGRVGRSLGALGAFAWAGISSAPPSPYNVEIGPHRRFEWVQGDLDRFRAIKAALGGTVNDVVLTAVAGALGAHLRAHGHPTRELVLKAMVPVSVRADVERGALGNRVSAMYAPLPVGVVDPLARFELVRDAMRGLKESGQAVSAEVITRLGDFASPTIMSQAARLQARQRLFNVVVTNVPGPQHPLYLAGRQLEHIYPMVPLAAQQALGIALMSYDGRLDFGLNADYDALEDLDALAGLLGAAVEELTDAAGVPRSTGGRFARADRSPTTTPVS